MNAKRRGLGKGLDALLGVDDEVEMVHAQEASARTDQVFRQLPVEWLHRGQFQPRQDMNHEALEELTQSIRAEGVMQPILVRAQGHETYEIVAGERRWRAAQMAGLANVPVIVRELSDQQTLAIALIENIQRENLNAMEEARALCRLQEEFGYSQQQVADAVGKSRSAVANLMRLTALEKDVATMLEHGDLEMGHGRALLGLSGQQQTETARIVAGKGLSVRETEALVRRILARKPDGRQQNSGEGRADIATLEQRLSGVLGAAVQIAHRANGKGKLSIKYNSVEELEGILDHIN